jgi:plasmid stability protein
MADLLVRDLPDDVHRELKRRASARRMSMQAYVARLLERHAAERGLQEWLEELDELPRHPDVVGSEALRQAREELP